MYDLELLQTTDVFTTVRIPSAMREQYPAQAELVMHLQSNIMITVWLTVTAESWRNRRI